MRYLDPHWVGIVGKQETCLNVTPKQEGCQRLVLTKSQTPKIGAN